MKGQCNSFINEYREMMDFIRELQENALELSDQLLAAKKDLEYKKRKQEYVVEEQNKKKIPNISMFSPLNTEGASEDEIIQKDELADITLKLADAEEVFANWASDPEVAKFMTWSTHPNVKVTKAWLADVEQNSTDSDRTYDWGFVRKADNKLIGSGGLYYKESQEAFDMGYNIMKDCWHQGYTTEAARAMAEFAFCVLNQKRIYANHAVDNPNSGKVMEKVGFRYFKDGYYDSMDGTKHFESKFYVLEAPEE